MSTMECDAELEAREGADHVREQVILQVRRHPLQTHPLQLRQPGRDVLHVPGVWGLGFRV